MKKTILIAIAIVSLFFGFIGCDLGTGDDQCPGDPNKTEPGVCGCGNPEIEGCSSVSITSPSNNSKFDVNASVTVNVDAQDADGVDNVELWIDNDNYSTDSEYPYTVTFNHLVAGDYTLTARLNDTPGNPSDSNPITITIENLPTDESNKGGSNTFTVKFKIQGNGKITGEKVQKVKKGKKTSKVKAIPKNGYVFSGWTGDYTSKKPRLRIKNVQSNMTVIAKFTEDNTGNNNGTPFKFIAYGDTRSVPSRHDKICNKMNSEDPELIIHAGDLWDGYNASTWKNHFTSKSNLNKLLSNNKILVAQGNHENANSVKNFSPSIVKNNSTTYSFLQKNVFFVCAGEDPSASYLEKQLKKSEAQNADFRIIFHHKPVYSAGSHGENGISAVEKICDQYNVAISFAGHDHHYERTKVMYNEMSVHSGSDVPANIQGTTYIVTGGGGVDLRSVGSKSWQASKAEKHHYCVLNAYSDRLEMKVKDIDGKVIDTLIRRK